MLIKSDMLYGYALHGNDGEFGKIREFYFDDSRWTVRYIVADTGNWLEDRLVLISPYALSSVIVEKRMVVVDLTKKQIADSPSAKTDEPVSRQFEEQYHAYFGWPSYWDGTGAWGNYPTMIPDRTNPREANVGGKEWDHHLRSTLAVKGYGIHATDGEIGHVDGYVLDIETWTIVYFIVALKNFLPGKKVLISPKWVERVSWEDSRVFVNLLQEAIRQSPVFSDSTIVDRNYEEALHRHYKLRGHWEIQDEAH